MRYQLPITAYGHPAAAPKIPQVRAELLGAREMNGVERSEAGWLQQPGRIEDAITDPQQVHPREYLAASPNRVGPEGKERAQDFRPGKGTRYERPISPEVTARCHHGFGEDRNELRLESRPDRSPLQVLTHIDSMAIM